MKKTARQIQKEQTREFLMKTAYECFSQRGIINTRMSDIAEAAGVSHGTGFLHFRTQEELVAEVVTACCGEIALRTHELSEGCASLREILAAHLSGIREFEPFYTRLVIENRFLPEPARDAWANIQSAVSFHFSRVAERELQAGTIRDIPSALLFNTWIGLIHYYLSNGDRFAPEGGAVERYGDTWIDAYLKMIQKEDRP
jgi:AcrR family transcriptional regulator